MTDHNLATLASIRDFAAALDADEELARRFVQDPCGTLDERGLNITFPERAGYRSMGELLTEIDESARLATLESIVSFTSKMEPRQAAESPDVLVFVFAVANANAGANANVGANANAAANANAGANANAAVNTNTNASGMTHLVNAVSPTHRVSLFDGYDDSAVARTLDDLRLARPRQAALLKRAVLDGDPHGDSHPAADGAELRTSMYHFRGHELRVRAVVTADEVKILDASIV